MYCRQCGYNNDQYSKLCHRCGSVLRDAEEQYTESAAEAAELQPGALKYARQEEDFLTRLKAPFRQLERATENHRRRWPLLIISASVIVICLAVWLSVLGTNACREEEELIYGADTANAALGGLAAYDSEFIYYSCPFGENPGLYRLAISTGEVLKISYHCLDSLSAVDGWIYGIDKAGTVLRISSDGLQSQQVIAETPVKSPVAVGRYLYFIAADCRLMRADLDTISRRSLARCELLTRRRVSEFIVTDGRVYFIELSEEDYNRLFTVTTTVTPEPITDAEGNEIKQEPYTVSELVVPSASDLPENPGNIWYCTLDGEEETELLATPVLRLTSGSGFLYFQTQTYRVISATDIDPNAPADMTYDLPVKKSWQLNLETLRYSTLLDAGVADSALTPTADGFIYYISPDENLERTDLSGDSRSNVLTYEQNTDTIAVCGEYIFVMCDNSTRMIRMRTDGTDHTLLCEVVPEVAAQEGQTGTDEGQEQ